MQCTRWPHTDDSFGQEHPPKGRKGRHSVQQVQVGQKACWDGHATDRVPQQLARPMVKPSDRASAEQVAVTKVSAGLLHSSSRLEKSSDQAGNARAGKWFMHARMRCLESGSQPGMRPRMRPAHGNLVRDVANDTAKDSCCGPHSATQCGATSMRCAFWLECILVFGS